MRAFQGRALPPGAYATQGQQANASTTNYLLDVSMGWPEGDYLDPQPLASGNVFQNQAYGNYVFGVYMAAARSSLNTALFGASALALGSGVYFTYRPEDFEIKTYSTEIASLISKGISVTSWTTSAAPDLWRSFANS